MQIGVQFLLYLRDLVDVLDRNLHTQEVTRYRGKLVLPSRFLEEPAGLWGFDLELKRAVSECS